jgi:hypothetical protein
MLRKASTPGLEAHARGMLRVFEQLRIESIMITVDRLLIVLVLLLLVALVLPRIPGLSRFFT